VLYIVLLYFSFILYFAQLASKLTWLDYRHSSCA